MNLKEKIGTASTYLVLGEVNGHGFCAVIGQAVVFGQFPAEDVSQRGVRPLLVDVAEDAHRHLRAQRDGHETEILPPTTHTRNGD